MFAMEAIPTRYRFMRSMRATKSKIAACIARIMKPPSMYIGACAIAARLTSAPINASRVSAAAKHLIEKLKSDVERTWKVEEIQKHLSNSGANVTNRYASNTLRKLYEKGHLVKVKRGLYRVNDSLLAIEGLEND